jgi:hypothetical protein
VLAKPSRTHWARRSHPAPLGIPDPQCDCWVLYVIHRPLRNHVRCYLDYPSRHSSLANRLCPKSFKVRDPERFQLDDG